MRIAISYTPNPININDLIFEILKRNKDKVAGVIITEGANLNKRSLLKQLEYYLSLLLILGPFVTFRSFLKILFDKFSKDNRIENFCRADNIKTLKVKTINSEKARNFLRELDVDLLFNQAHHIIKKDVIDIPPKGVLNIHGGMLPKYRGMFTPFWQLYNGEEYRGVCYHLVAEKLDSGPIVYQEKIKLHKSDTVNKLIRQKFRVAVAIFPKALEVLDRDDWRDRLQPNEDTHADYFTFPTLKQAWEFRWRRVWGENSKKNAK